MEIAKAPIQGAMALQDLTEYRRDPKVFHIPDHALEPSMHLSRNPIKWWQDYGNNCVALQDVALRILSMPATAAGGERNFSTWSFIWSNTRAKMLSGRVGKLVYIYYNSRVLKRAKVVLAASDWDSFIEYLENLAPLEVLAEGDLEQPPVVASDSSGTVADTELLSTSLAAASAVSM